MPGPVPAAIGWQVLWSWLTEREKSESEDSIFSILSRRSYLSFASSIGI